MSYFGGFGAGGDAGGDVLKVRVRMCDEEEIPVGRYRCFMVSELSFLVCNVKGVLHAIINPGSPMKVPRDGGPSAAEAQAVVATFAEQWEQKRLGDQQALLSALQKMNARHTQDYAALRKELETVAVFSEAGWQSAQNQISSLAMTPSQTSEAK